MQAEYDASPEVMLAFYGRLYPFKSIFSWLNHEHAPTRLFTHREFSFTLGDVYIRYNSFSTVEDFKRQVCKLNPSRFEIGAVYSAKPRDKKTLRAGALLPVQRELVFDIDMTDYDAIRTCCSGKGICKRCWGFIAAAVKVLDRALRDEFGFRHLLWVYSGRRGIHCWISDNEAMQLTDDQRKAIMGWLEVIKGGRDTVKKVNVRVSGRSLHPSLRSAVNILGPEFTELILHDQNCFLHEEQWSTLLEIISDKDVAARLRKKWDNDADRSSEDKWKDVKREAFKQMDEKERSPLTSSMEDVILQYTYPRLDAEVSKHRNHLLKAPFCVHPSTGRVCVPVDPVRVSEFNPETVPTVGMLLRELDAFGPAEGATESTHHSDWEKTSLKPYVDMLDEHVRGLMAETRRVKREAGNMSMEF